MPIVIDASDAPRTLRYTVSGAWPSVVEQHEIRLGLIARGELTAETRGLFDIRAMTSAPTLEATQATIDQAVNDGTGSMKRAFLVLPGVQYGVVRQVQALSPPELQVQVFTDEAAAVKWLFQS